MSSPCPAHPYVSASQRSDLSGAGRYPDRRSRGSAADLASRGCLAVYPAVGWWKTRQALERYDQTARYALIVSIRAPEMDVDLRTEVANQIGVPVEIEN